MNTKTYLSFLAGFAAGACFIVAFISVLRPKESCIKCECPDEEPATDKKQDGYTPTTKAFVDRMKNRHTLKSAFDKAGDKPCEDSSAILAEAIYEEKYNQPLDVDSFDLNGTM
jgi:hypothetical protein